jgi:hypothetical protein
MNGTRNATVPKVKKNSTIPDGSKEPPKLTLSNTTKNSSAPTKAENITKNMDKIF